MQHNSTRVEQLYTRFELYLLMMLPSRYLLTQSERPQTHILKNAGHGGIIVFSATGEGGRVWNYTTAVILGWGAKEIDRGPWMLAIPKFSIIYVMNTLISDISLASDITLFSFVIYWNEYIWQLYKAKYSAWLQKSFSKLSTRFQRSICTFDI